MPNLKNKKVIKDQQGQRKYPGRVTEIQGNTMATTGYGDIPLYVVPNVGNPMVVPANSGNRVFPGASSFTEYPIAKNGGWLEKYQDGGLKSVTGPAPKFDAKTEAEGKRIASSYNNANKQNAQISQTRNWSQAEKAHSDMVKDRINNPASDVGILGANIASNITRFRNLTPEEIARTTDNVGETVNLSSEMLKDGLINELVGYGATKAIPFVSKSVKAAGKYFTEEKALNNVSKNLIDLQEAKKFAQEYGYELPENLERISQSNKLTDKTIRGMMDRHNTFVRGVSTNWDEIAKRNPEILRHLENKGIDWQNNPKAAAEYMSTHIPISTGYGRASLNNEVFDRGLEGLYTSNSFPTAEGYTYGKGFVVKAKKPTDFSSPNRKDWITKNNPHYRDEDKFRELVFPLSDEGQYALYSSKSKSWRPKPADEKLLKNATSKQKAIKQVEYRIEELKKDISKIEPNKDKWIDAPEVLSSKKELVKQLENDVKYLHQHGDEILQAPGEFNLLRTEREAELDIKNGFKFNEKLREFLKSKGKDIHSSKPASEEGENLYQQILNQESKYRNAVEDGLTNKAQSEFIHDFLINKYPEFSDFSNSNKYAHYIHLGTPGKKVLEPIKSWEITPEIWKNKSRAHTNKYSKKFSALKYGGWLDTYQDGGETDTPVNLRSASTPLTSAVSTQAPEVPLNKTGWDWVKQKYENRQPSEWNMLMMDKSGSYVDSGVDPFSLMLASPQQVIKAGVKGGKALLDATKSNKIKQVIHEDEIMDIKNLKKSFKEAQELKDKDLNTVEIYKNIKNGEKWKYPNVNITKEQYNSAKNNLKIGPYTAISFAKNNPDKIIIPSKSDNLFKNTPSGNAFYQFYGEGPISNHTIYTPDIHDYINKYHPYTTSRANLESIDLAKKDALKDVNQYFKENFKDYKIPINDFISLPQNKYGGIVKTSQNKQDNSQWLDKYK